MSRRIALFGGSFDPIHTDHVNIIKACHDDLKYDEVWVIPAYVNPFKNVSTSSVAQRLAMIKIAIKDLPYARISKYEISKQKKSYTYETIKHFNRHYPDDEFTFVIGSDQLDSFEKWNYFDELIEMIKFIVFKRSDKINEEIIRRYKLETFTFNNNFLSSTDIRNLVHLEKQIKEVNDYINHKLMYLHERLEIRMDAPRYFHSLNVGQTALELAILNGVDPDKALIAGTLHDVAKKWPEEKMGQYILKYQPDLIREPKPTWHSYVGAFHLRHDWLINDEEIVAAVYKHTVGEVDMSPLDMIIFCADKISPERNYPKVDKMRKLVKSDLRMGFIALLKQQVEIAKEKHGQNTIGAKAQKVYEYWLRKENEIYE